MHGIYHDNAELEVENFLSLAELPVQIITGNSQRMADIVRTVVKKFKLDAIYSDPRNTGCLTIIEKL